MLIFHLKYKCRHKTYSTYVTQGFHTFQEIKFPDFSLTCPWLHVVFPWPKDKKIHQQMQFLNSTFVTLSMKKWFKKTIWLWLFNNGSFHYKNCNQDQIPSFFLNSQILLTKNEILWLFNDLEKYQISGTFSVPVETLYVHVCTIITKRSSW